MHLPEPIDFKAQSGGLNRKSTIFLLFATTAFVPFVIWFSWTGFVASDDWSYAAAAEQWVQKGWNLGATHWSLRYAIVLPTAGFFKLFGRSELSLEATGIVYFLILLGLVFKCALRTGTVLSAILTTALLASVPMVSLGPSYLTTDIPEAVFLLGSLVCFHSAWNGRQKSIFFLSGALLGLAIITRETSICLMLFYTFLFAIGYKRDRGVYLWMGFGFLLIWGVDSLALLSASGDALYRLHTTFRGVDIDRLGLADNNSLTDGFDTVGVMAAPRWIKPVLMMLANQQIGPVTWLGIPAAIAVIRSKDRHSEYELSRLLAYFCFTWFVITTYIFYKSLFLSPRYQVVSVASLVVCLNAYKFRISTSLRCVTSITIVLGIVITDLFLIGFSDRQLMFSERQLVAIMRETPEKTPVWTDPATYVGAYWLLSLNGYDKRVAAGVPPPGGLYVFNTKPRRQIPSDWSIKTEPGDWEVLARYREPARPLVVVLRQMGLSQYLPSVLLQKLESEQRMTVVLRAPAVDH